MTIEFDSLFGFINHDFLAGLMPNKFTKTVYINFIGEIFDFIPTGTQYCQINKCRMICLHEIEKLTCSKGLKKEKLIG